MWFVKILRSFTKSAFTKTTTGKTTMSTDWWSSRADQTWFMIFFKKTNLLTPTGPHATSSQTTTPTRRSIPNWSAQRRVQRIWIVGWQGSFTTTKSTTFLLSKKDIAIVIIDPCHSKLRLRRNRSLIWAILSTTHLRLALASPWSSTRVVWRHFSIQRLWKLPNTPERAASYYLALSKARTPKACPSNSLLQSKQN